MIGVTLTGANVHHKWMVGETLDAVVVSAPRGPRRSYTWRADCVPRGNAEKWTPVLIVAVTVALAVIAPGFVAALVNWNDIVKVVDAARRSRSDELREHGHDALDQIDAALVQLAFDQLIELHHVDVRGASIAEPRAIV